MALSLLLPLEAMRLDALPSSGDVLASRRSGLSSAPSSDDVRAVFEALSALHAAGRFFGVVRFFLNVEGVSHRLALDIFEHGGALYFVSGREWYGGGSSAAGLWCVVRPLVATAAGRDVDTPWADAHSMIAALLSLSLSSPLAVRTGSAVFPS